jgi:general secretion pathway protein G
MKIPAKKRSGFTLVELMVVLTVIALLLSVVVPDYIGRMHNAEEAVLRENLTLMRDALDKHYADAGRYPAALDELVSKRYLRSIPPDPFTRSASSWVAVPPPGQQREKGNVYDVKSGAKGYEAW